MPSGVSRKGFTHPTFARPSSAEIEHAATLREQQRTTRRSPAPIQKAPDMLTPTQTQRFEQDYQKYRGMLESFANGLVGDREIARQLVQQAYEQALPTYANNGETTKTFFYRIVGNLGRDHSRRESMRKRHGETDSLEHLQEQYENQDYPTQPATQGNPDDIAITHDLEQRILQKITPLQRSAFILATNGYSPEEIGNALGIGVPASKMRVSRARETAMQAVQYYNSMR